MTGELEVLRLQFIIGGKSIINRPYAISEIPDEMHNFSNVKNYLHAFEKKQSNGKALPKSHIAHLQEATQRGEQAFIA